jgi:hypothetical protein
VANYDSGSLSVLPLSYTHKSPDSGGSPRLTPKLGDASAVLSFTRNGTGPVSNRQDGSYAHDVVVSPDGAYVFVCDLGADVIRVIRPASSACKDAAHVADIPLGAGSGPRHLKFFVDAAKGKTFAYLSSEFANTITSFLYAPTASSDEVLQQIGEPSFSSPPTLPLGGNKADGPKRTLAEVQVAPNGRFVFASNRGDSQEDSISVLTRGDNGRASWTYWYRSGGLNPRHVSWPLSFLSSLLTAADICLVPHSSMSRRTASTSRSRTRTRATSWFCASATRMAAWTRWPRSVDCQRWRLPASLRRTSDSTRLRLLALTFRPVTSFSRSRHHRHQTHLIPLLHRPLHSTKT